MLYFRCDVLLLKFLCMKLWRKSERRDVYFLNIYYIRVIYRFNRNRTLRPLSVAQLVATKDNMCRDRGSNPGFPTSPHIMCVNLTTRLLDKKKRALQPTVNTYTIVIKIKLVLVYYNRVKPKLFKVHVDVTLLGLRDQLDQINGHLIKYL